MKMLYIPCADGQNILSTITSMLTGLSSTIDLIFHNAHLTATCAKVISCTSTAPLRKHLPVMAERKMNCSNTNKNNITNKVKRHLNINLLKETYSSNKRLVEQLIKQGEIQKAVSVLERTIKTAQIPNINERSAKIWFDKDCYRERKFVIESLHRAKETASREI
jgi:hypothetical protein